MPDIIYVGPGGSPTGAGNSWATRRDTITNGMGLIGTAGDILYVGPGVYREQVTLGAHGQIHDWTGGTVSVTEGSKIVTGAGTGWVAGGAVAGDQFMISWLAYGTDGDCDVGAPGTMTTATETFEATAVGFCINIRNGVNGGSYLIASVVGAPSGSITLTDINNIGWPVDINPNYTFFVPSNEGSYEIESVDSDTQITLTRPWSGPTYPGRDYDMWRPIYLIGDMTGAHTDGVGGVVRITGSDNDQTAVRPYCIFSNNESFWHISGFQVDTTTKTNNNGDNIEIDGGTYFTLEDIRSLSPAREHIFFDGGSNCNTVRRCAFFGGNFDLATRHSTGINLYETVMTWGTYALHVENCLFECDFGVRAQRYQNITMKSCTSGMQSESFAHTDNIDLGGCFFVHDCEIHYGTNIAIWALGAAHEIVANWNNLWDNNQKALGWTWGAGTEGPNSTEYCYIPEMPRLVDDYRYPIRLYPPTQWWSPAQHTGLYPANEDIYGVPRPTIKTKRSLGHYQDLYIERDVATVYGGVEASMEHRDARTTQWRIASSCEPVTITVWVRRETNYTGTLPRLVVHQAGNTDVEVTAVSAVDTWEQLSVSYTPNAQPPIVWASVVSDNATAPGALIATYWQHFGDALT